MAVIDPQDDCVVIRVVYDGAPMAGKTTSVAALGRGLGASIYSPADYNGRTLYFDWLDYTGGLFEGRRIRCQIVSVPGQATLAPRRRRLLRSADVVVFVGDSSAAGFEADRRYLGALRGVLDKVSGPPIGIVFQANKRDLTNATPVDQLRAMLDELELRSAIVESVATEGAGIREAFVFAVRLALDRIRELISTGSLTTTRPQVNSAAELLQELRQAEPGALDLDLAMASSGLDEAQLHPLQRSGTLASQALQEAMQANVASPVNVTATAIGKRVVDTPAVPDEKVASGLVWPPVDGRTILHEMAQAAVNLRSGDDGGWRGTINDRWSLHSAQTAVFADIEAGRAELVRWAGLHVANSKIISKHRCVVLADDGLGRFRLWQLVRREVSLRTRIESALTKDASVIADALLSSARTFLEMAARLVDTTCELSLTLDTVGWSTSGPVYIGHLATPSIALPARSWSAAQATDALISELSFAQPTLRAHRSHVFAELARLARDPDSYTPTEWRVLQKLVALTRS
jgi:signal recognition particle receptor subunit beta